jgi:chorismate-pyruvate lyase
LHVRRQETTVDVPPSVRAQLRGERFLERITSITAHGEVMMDNLSYIALEGLEAPVECALREGRTPIGHLLNQWWVRRETVDDAGELAERLWRVVGLPDAEASRCYRIDTPQGPRMLITETYRRGMLTAPR